MIKLVKNAITDEGFKVLLSYLSTDTYTKVLNLTSNQITHKSFPHILQFITLNNICKMIYLSNNKVSQMHLKKIQSNLDSKFMQVLLWFFIFLTTIQIYQFNICINEIVRWSGRKI